MGKIAGIDLGTTFSALSILNENGKAEIVKNFDGDYLTESVVAFPSEEEGKVYVGKEAKDHLSIEPDRVIKEVKRDMGTDKTYPVAGQEHTPSGISSMILKKLVQDSEKQHGKIEDVVVTIPANFPDGARKDTEKAIKNAGLNFKHIIEEPTAAILHYASSNSLAGKVMIYDFGGGTFDITIAEVNGKDIKCLASHGDSRLGGTDIDREILEKIKKAYKKDKGSDLITSKADEYRYTFVAEDIKKKLSKKDKYSTLISGPNGDLKFTLTRKDFEESISILMQKIDTLIDVTLNEINIDEKDITDVLLVGGSTRLPIITERILKKFNKEPLTGVNVDEAVSLGAALYAGKKADPAKLSATQTEELKKIDLKTVCNFYFGTIIVDYNDQQQKNVEYNATMLSKNTPLPCSKTQTFYTIYDGQTSVECEITQSLAENTDPSFAQSIWKGSLDNLPPNRPAHRPIEVTFSYDENGQMKCKYKDVESNKELPVELYIDKEQSDEPSSDDFTIE